MSEALKKPEPEEEEFDIVTDEDEGEDTKVEVVDTTPEADKHKELLAPEKEELDEPDEDELQSYSERVQKRIKDATFKFHDQRRKREVAEREREEAIKFAQAQLQRAQQMEAALYQYEAGFVDQSKQRAEAQLAKASDDLKKAFEQGDADKMAAAQAEIAKLSVQADQYSRFTPRQPDPGTQVYQPAPQVRPRDDDADRFNEWRGKNAWFENDQVMHDFAMGVHTRMAAENPEVVGTDDYYREIDKAVRSAFPAKFNEGNPRTRQTPTPPVGGVTRNSGAEKTRKTIRLTSEQMALCRKLGITPQQYVREMNKLGE